MIYPPSKIRDVQEYSAHRLREFDAMRGFSMILVVFAHVLLSAGVEGQEAVFPSAITMFRLPLFFFVSGFFAYRDLNKWTGPTLKRVLIQKVKAQIICTLVFYTFRYYTLGVNPLGWSEKGFQGYWFTIVLFQMFVLYTLTNLMSAIIKKDVSVCLMALIALTGLGVILSHHLPDNRLWTVISGTNICYYTQWFVLGLAVRKYYAKFSLLIGLNAFRALLIGGFIGICCVLYSDYVTSHEILSKLFSLLGSYVGLMMVVALFNYAKDYFQKDENIPNVLCFIGRRTLDIYMLHYFFLPTLVCLSGMLYESVFFQITIAFGIALIVVAISLAASWCLRTSSFLSDWLFGVKPIPRIHSV